MNEILLEKTIIVPKAEVKKYEKLLKMKKVNFEKYGIEADATVEEYTAKFETGISISVYIDAHEDTLSVNISVCDENDNEIAFFEMDDEFMGDFDYYHNGYCYCINLVPGE